MNGPERHGSYQNPGIKMEMPRQDANMVHRQPALAAQQFRTEGAVATQDPREIGGGHFVLFQQKLERFGR